MKYLAVKDFRRFQHYKHRNPIWIKLYASILHDPAFLRLPEVAQAQLVKLWVLASQAGDPLPNDAKFLARAIGTSRVQLDALIASGFLIPTDNASGSLEVCAQNASNKSAAPCAREEGEVETEVETETESSSSPRVTSDGEAQVAARLATDADRNALTALMVRVPNPESWLASMRASLDGMAGHVHVTPLELGQALRDFMANGAEPNGRLFRRYLTSAKQENDRPSSAGRTLRVDGGGEAGNAAHLLAQIRGFVESYETPGSGRKQIIRRAKVSALGDDVLRAYEAIGGAERILATKPEHLGILTRDFAAALASAAGAAA